MRRIIVVLILIGTMYVAVPKAHSQSTSLPICMATQVNDEEAIRNCLVASQSSTSPVAPAGQPSGASASGAGGPIKKWLPYDKLTTGPDGQPCMTTGYYEEGTSPTDGVPANPANPQPFIYANLAESYPPCPETPRAAGQAAPVETPRMIAARYWQQVPLPKPDPSIAPGRAITGKAAYLVTGGQITDTFRENTVYGILELTAVGRYFVDWGDGTKSGPFPFKGEPWPHGQITHEYQKVGIYDVVVTEHWSGIWRLSGQSGVLAEVQTAARINDFPVQEIQAVIRQ